MKYIFLVCCIIITIPVQSQSADELAIKKQLFQFQKAHNNGHLDSMMMIVSSNYQETFLPDVVYDVNGIRQYYKGLIDNPAYDSKISYRVEDLDVQEKMAVSNVMWEYFIYPRNGKDTLYHSLNKGIINWTKDDGIWKMQKSFGGNISETNKISDHSAQTAIRTSLLDFVAYFNSKNLEGLMSLYDRKVKGISVFNGSYITHTDLKQKYRNIFQNEKLDIEYDLEGMEELTYSGNLAYCITILTHKVKNKENGITSSSKYKDMTIWRQREDGDWNIVSFVRKEIE